MRTTIELPDTLYRQIKARAALEGLPVKALVRDLLQRGLATGAGGRGAAAPSGRSTPPTIEVNQPFPSGCPSNAALFELLDEPGPAR